MANLSNINNILRISSSGVGLNKDNTGPSKLDIESAGADIIDMTRTGQKTYRFAISGASAFSLFDVAANADRLVINSAGNATFAGNVTTQGGLNITGANNTTSTLKLTNTAATPDNSWSLTPQYNSQDLHLLEDTTTQVTFKSGGNVTFAGNVGIGITPSASFSGIEVLQIGGGMTLYGGSGDRATMASNLIVNTGTAFEYVINGLAGRFSIEDGYMIWGTAPTGTAGQVATVTTRMTLMNDGRVGIGVTPSYANVPLHTKNIGGGDSFNIFEGIGNAWVFGEADQVGTKYCQVAGRYGHHSGINVDLGGNVGIGTVSPAGKLEIKTGSSYTGHTQPNIKLINFGYRDAELNVFAEGSYFTHYFENYSGGNGRYYDRSLEIVCKGQPDGTYGEGVIKFKANPITAGSNAAEIMRITGAGKVGIGTTSPSKKLTVDGGILVGGNNTDVGASQIYGDIRRPQSQYYCERIWKRNSGATPQTYNVARQWHDHANWSGGHINVIIWGTGPTLGQLFKADFSCGYGYSGGSVHVSVNFNPGGIALPVWGAAVQVSGNIHYRDLTITPPGYNTYVVQVINPGGIIQTYDINNTGQAIYFYPQ